MGFQRLLSGDVCRDVKEGDEILVRYAHGSKTPNGSWQPDVWLPMNAQFITVAAAIAARSVVDLLTFCFEFALSVKFRSTFGYIILLLICREVSSDALLNDEDDDSSESLAADNSDSDSDSDFGAQHASELSDIEIEPEIEQGQKHAATAQSL